MKSSEKDGANFRAAVESREPVSGLTHHVYRYPARFSPMFARAAIQTFTAPGDLVLDPFMGAGTTLVEALALDRRGIGIDVSSLAHFLATVKTTRFTLGELSKVRKWAKHISDRINIRSSTRRPTSWIAGGYQRHLNSQGTWRIRKALEMCLNQIASLSEREKQLARLLVLGTAQWALDCRDSVPSLAEFRSQLVEHGNAVISAAQAFRQATKAREVTCLLRSAEGLEKDPLVRREPPRLVLTSPPYPGVHVVYHRWQILGRKETGAPFWIANSIDGMGASHYTLGDRKQAGLTSYFTKARAIFKSVAAIMDSKTVVVQLIGFNDATWQLNEYLRVLEDSGLREEFWPDAANASDGRLWRNVPNRKWYADQRGQISASAEVVLFHRLR